MNLSSSSQNTRSLGKQETILSMQANDTANLNKIIEHLSNSAALLVAYNISKLCISQRLGLPLSLVLAVGFLRHAPISRNLAIPSLVAIMTIYQFFYVTNPPRYSMSASFHARQPLSVKHPPVVHLEQPCHLMHCLRYLRLQHQVNISVRQACDNQPLRASRPRLGHPFWRSYDFHCIHCPSQPLFPQVALGETS